MSDVLLDTTVCIDSFNAHAKARQLIERLMAGTDRIFVSPITVFELWLRPLSQDEEQAHSLLLASCTEAPFDHAAGRIMSAWLRGQPRSGRKRLLGDAMIAATVASLNATILTRNPRDFTRFYPNVQYY